MFSFSFQLKPYVSYSVPDIQQSEITAKDIFNSVYAKDVVDKYRKGKVDVENLTVDDILKEK